MEELPHTCKAQPRATASSAFRVVLTSFPRNPEMCSFTAGIRVAPPTISTLLMSSGCKSMEHNTLEGKGHGPTVPVCSAGNDSNRSKERQTDGGGSPLCLQGWAWHTNLCSPLFKTPTSSGSRPLFVEGRKGGCVDALEGASTHVDVCHVTLRGSLPRGRQYAHATHRGRCQHLQTPRDALPRVPTYWLVPAQPSVVA